MRRYPVTIRACLSKPLAVSVGFLIFAFGLTAIALAASPTKGATYSGNLKPEVGPVSSGTPISLRISSSGKKLAGVEIDDFPLFCEGGGPPQVIRFTQAKIKGGKFKATGTSKTEKQFGGGLTATAVLTGKFLAKGRERGTFKDTFVHSPQCGGTTTYSTEVAPR